MKQYKLIGWEWKIKAFDNYARLNARPVFNDTAGRVCRFYPRNLSNLRNKKGKRKFSSAARRRLLDKCYLLLTFYKKAKKNRLIKQSDALVFVTLTAPATVSDRDFKKIFKYFTVYYERITKKRLLYVARFEKQKNSNLHAHFLTVGFVDYFKVRTAWLHACEVVAGLVSKYSEKMNSKNFDVNTYLEYRKELAKKNGQRWTKEKERQATEYIEKELRKEKEKRFRTPNAVDVKAINNKTKAIAYICKYITKTNTEIAEEVEGNHWSACKVLRSAKEYCDILADSAGRQLLCAFDLFSDKFKYFENKGTFAIYSIFFKKNNKKLFYYSIIDFLDSLEFYDASSYYEEEAKKIFA
jgi:hypothetical protein